MGMSMGGSRLRFHRRTRTITKKKCRGSGCADEDSEDGCRAMLICLKCYVRFPDRLKVSKVLTVNR
jgi:hypothetical protein